MQRPGSKITGYRVTYGSGSNYTEEQFAAEQEEQARAAYLSACKRPHHANTARIEAVTAPRT